MDIADFDDDAARFAASDLSEACELVARLSLAATDFEALSAEDAAGIGL